MLGLHVRTVVYGAGVVFLMLCFTAAALAQTSTFTYQGQLTESGSPANGLYDMEFKLYDALIGGSLQGSPNTVTLTGVNVTNGIFTVQLDFGTSAFLGADRFLDIGVKHPADPTYTPLTPRQQIASTPYAIRTLSATSADGLSGACVACVTDAQVSANVVLQNGTQTLTNKTIDSSTNTVTADKLRTATTVVDVKSSPAPTTGQVLTATGSSSATWQTLGPNWAIGG